ncbi:MAG: hypothetical protein JXA15_09805 [Spirochaetales bacterium]|nr:hypothetical protein [Spirochaetales bacterium]
MKRAFASTIFLAAMIAALPAQTAAPKPPSAPSAPAAPAAGSPTAPAAAGVGWKAFVLANYPDTGDVVQAYFSELVTAYWTRALPFGSKAVTGKAGAATVSVEDADKLWYVLFTRGGKLGSAGDRVVERNKEKSGILLQSKVLFLDGTDSYVRIRPPNYATTSLDVVVAGAVAAKDIPVAQMMLYLVPAGLERLAELSARVFDWNQVFRSAPESSAARLALALKAGGLEKGAWKPLSDALRKADVLAAVAGSSEVVSSGYTLFAADSDPRGVKQPYAPFPLHDAAKGGWPLRAARALAFEGSKLDDAAFLLQAPASADRPVLRVLLVPHRGEKGFAWVAYDLESKAAVDAAALAAADPERRVRVFRIPLAGR